MIIKKLFNYIFFYPLFYKVNNIHYFKNFKIGKDYQIKNLVLENNTYFNKSINYFFNSKEAKFFLPNNLLDKKFTIPKSMLKLTFSNYFSLLTKKRFNLYLFFASILIKWKKFLSPELQNFIYSKSKIPIFWEELIHQNSGLIVRTNDGLKRTPAVSTSICDQLTGSIICHIYNLEKILICPIYQGSLNQNNGLAIYSQEHNSLYFIFTSKLEKYFKTRNKSLFNFAKSITEGYKNSKSKIQKKFIYVGGKVNYGHTIINDTKYIEYISNVKNRRFDFLLGNYDYFCTLDIKKREEGRKIRHNFFYLNKYLFNKNFYSLPNILVLPLPSYRPDPKNLKIISYPLKKKINLNSKRAFYLLLDERKGKRCLRNKLSLIHIICSKLKSNKINFLIIDGFTSIPKYKSQLKVSLYKLSQKLIKKTSLIAKSYGINLIMIDGKKLTLKNKICSNYKILYGFASYGSGMAYPIYILNIPLSIGGTDSVISKKVFNKWHWHFTKYCHMERYVKEDLVPSSSFSENGYTLNTKIMGKLLDFRLKEN